MTIKKNVSIIYEDLLKRTSYRTFLKGIAFAFVVLLVSQLLQNLLVWFVSLDKIEWMKSLSKWYAIRGVFSEQLFISLVGAILTLVVYINKEFWKIHKDCKELETILSVFNRSLPHSKSLLSEMRYRAFLVAHGGEDAAKITNRIDPKLFSSLDYGNKIVTKTPPPIRLDEQYIDDIFNKNVNTIYTLWTEEPSTWLDPMMQFYLANLGIRNLTELVNRLGNGLDIYNRDSVEYRSFESYKQSMLATKGFKMARIVLLKEEWFKLYEDELAILLAISEIFHLPCFFIKKEALINIINNNPIKNTELINHINQVKTAINTLGAVKPSNIDNIIAWNHDRNELSLIGFLAFNEINKFYIYTDDVNETFKGVTDPNNVSLKFFEWLIDIYTKYPECKGTLSDGRINQRHVIIKGK